MRELYVAILLKVALFMIPPFHLFVHHDELHDTLKHLRRQLVQVELDQKDMSDWIFAVGLHCLQICLNKLNKLIKIFYFSTSKLLSIKYAFE